MHSKITPLAGKFKRKPAVSGQTRTSGRKKQPKEMFEIPWKSTKRKRTGSVLFVDSEEIGTVVCSYETTGWCLVPDQANDGNEVASGIIPIPSISTSQFGRHTGAITGRIGTDWGILATRISWICVQCFTLRR